MALHDDEHLVDAHVASMQADQQIGKVKLPRITAQQRHYVAARVSGLNCSASSKEAGVSRVAAHHWEKNPAVQQHMDHYLQEYTDKVLPRIAFGVEQAHMMYMEAYHSAGTSAEMTRATDSLVKLHRLHEQADGERGAPTNVKQLESLDTQQLLRYAAIGMDSLSPGSVIEGEYADVEADVDEE